MHPRLTLLAGAALGAALLAATFGALPLRAERAATALPAATLEAATLEAATLGAGARTGLQTAVFAGGCFWGVQAVFQHIEGVTQAVSGYAGGTVPDPGYERVSAGTTGHTEAVRVTFDPARVSYATLLRIFFSVALDPTELNRQGPDVGTQYRSALFVDGPEQDAVARAYIAQLDRARVFDRPIVTTVGPAGAFYPAEPYHQDYLVLHPHEPYIAYNDVPKVEALQRLFPVQWRQTPVLVGASTAAR